MSKKRTKASEEKKIKTFDATHIVRCRIIDDRPVYTVKITVSPLLMAYSYIQIYITAFFKSCVALYKHQRSLQKFEWWIDKP